jgi:hypothetical protein
MSLMSLISLISLPKTKLSIQKNRPLRPIPALRNLHFK